MLCLYQFLSDQGDVTKLSKHFLAHKTKVKIVSISLIFPRVNSEYLESTTFVEIITFGKAKTMMFLIKLPEHIKTFK